MSNSLTITAAQRQQLADLKVEVLAKQFADVLLEWLEPEQFADMQRDNTERADPKTCASHDYCDANMAMQEAFAQATSPTFDVCAFMEECDAAVQSSGVDAANAAGASAIFDKWNAAWALAYKLYLTVQPEPVLLQYTTEEVASMVKVDGWSWEHPGFWSFDYAGSSYALGNANGFLSCDIYVGDDVVDVKDFPNMAAAHRYMQEVARG